MNQYSWNADKALSSKAFYATKKHILQTEKEWGLFAPIGGWFFHIFALVSQIYKVYQ